MVNTLEETEHVLWDSEESSPEGMDPQVGDRYPGGGSWGDWF